MIARRWSIVSFPFEMKKYSSFLTPDVLLSLLSASPHLSSPHGLQPRCPEGHEFSFLPRSAKESGSLHCWQNGAYRKHHPQELDRRRWSSSSTQTLREIHHAANAQVTTLAYIHTVLKLFNEVIFLYPSKWWSRPGSAFQRPAYRVQTGYLHGAHGKVPSYFLWLQSSCIFPPNCSDNSLTCSRISPATLGRKCFQTSKI